jgi:hypothetical protein
MSSGVKGSQPLLMIVIVSQKVKPQVREQDLRIHSISFGLVSIEPHHRELGLDLARVHADYSHSSGDELFPQALGESSDGCFGCAVDASPGVRLTACNRSDVDDVAGTGAFVSLKHAPKNFLGHVDEACDVSRKHDVHVFFGDIWGSGDAFYQATV